MKMPKADKDDLMTPTPATSVSGTPFKLGVLDQVMNFRMLRIRNLLTARYREETSKLGLRPGSFGALAIIEANPGIAQIDVAKVGGYDQTALVCILDDFEARGWATRARDPSDRRRHRVEITDAGREALSGLLERALQNERPARDALDTNELAALRNAIDKIYTRLFLS